MIKERRAGWVGQIAHVAVNVSTVNLKERNHLEDLGIDENTVLK
jgi:uncharacterized protein YkvS